MSRTRLMLLTACSSLFLVIPLSAQQAIAPTAVPSPSVLLQKSLAVLVGNVSISDVTLTGTVRCIAGSDDESGSATLKALSSGVARTDLNLPSGSRSELTDLSSIAPSGSSSGPSAVSRAIPFHNLLSEPSWSFPAFSIARRLSSPAFVATYVGHESRDGQAVEHISISQTPPSADLAATPTFAHLTQIDFFLDSTTLLPVAITFNIHPDDNELLDIPVEIRFSDYRASGGTQIPFHIQKSLNGSLVLDFRAQSAVLNSGLTSAQLGGAQ